ncbi:MAG TPA: zinc metallopeptidase [Anaerolineaceae bacterium]|nr:zinc metallopeptidase [Anaerolineaceae bacterium]
MYGYGLYLLISLPALILGLWAQAKVQGAYKKYSQVRTSNGMNGADVARHILDSNGLSSVAIKQTGGTLSDNYDPRNRTLNLSTGVYQSNSIAAAGVAAHEAGHAIQHKESYGPLKVRSLMIPTVQLGSWLGPILFFVGYFFSNYNLALIGVILFAGIALFSILTIPVELDASKRAKAILASEGILYGGEMEGVSQVLDAAAWTYVAAATQAISTVLYYVLLLGGRSSRRR